MIERAIDTHVCGSPYGLEQVCSPIFLYNQTLEWRRLMIQSFIPLKVSPLQYWGGTIVSLV